MFWPGPSANGSYAGIGSEQWEQCEPITAFTVVEQINHLLLGEAEGEPQSRNLTYRSASSSETLNVTDVYRRHVIFYDEESGPWYLYRLDCDATGVDYLVGYRDVAIFAINKAEILKNKAESAENSWTLIDWQAATIYSMKQHLNIDIKRLSKDNSELEKIRDYLNFFCSFIGGNSDIGGAAAPFVMPSFDQMGWEDDAWEVLECINPLEKLQVFQAPSGANNADPFDSHESTIELAGEPEWTGPIAEKREACSKSDIHKEVQKLFKKLASNPTAVLPETQLFADLAERTKELNNKQSPIFYALIWYNAGLFAASFKINMPIGSVEILDDIPVPDAMSLPVPRYLVVASKNTRLRLLCRQGPIEQLSAQDLLERIEQVGLVDGAPAPRLRGLRIVNEFKTSKRFGVPIRLEDVEFADDVTLDDAIFDRSLTFEGCVFLRRFRARNLTVDGMLRLNNSRFSGAVKGHEKKKQADPAQPVIDLRGASVGRGLFADRVEVLGRVRMEWIRIDGPFRARGLQLFPRPGYDRYDQDEVLDLCHAQLAGQLDLRADAEEREERQAPGSERRTVIGGAVKMESLHADHVNFSGARFCGYLSMSHARLRGQVDLRPLLPRSFWRCRMDGDLNLDHIHATVIAIHGLKTASDFSLSESKIQSIYAVPIKIKGKKSSGWFRPEIGGDLLLSGAKIETGVDAYGLKVAGLLHYITGRCGRLRLSSIDWERSFANRKVMSAVLRSELAGMRLMEMNIDSSILLAGIRILKPSDAEAPSDRGSIIVESVCVGSDFRFWPREGKNSFLAFWGPRRFRPVEKKIERLHARIPKHLDIKGIRVGGTLDLSRVDVKGQVRLDNAEVQKEVRACDNDGTALPCSFVGSLSANMLEVGGDADFRGLTIRKGDFIARDAAVKGNLLLATADRGKCRPLMTSVGNGAVDLTGTTAASLAIDANSLVASSDGSAAAARVSLAQCRLARLSVRGFEENKKEWGHAIDLTAIEVKDWDIIPETEALPLLRSMEPFDARVALDMEQRLARTGKKSLADRIFRYSQRRRLQSSGSHVAWRRWFLTKWGFLVYRMKIIFNGAGTVPELMFGWLILFMLASWAVLWNPANIEFPSATADERTLEQAVSEGRTDDPGKDWSGVRAFGMAVGYAVPVFSGNRSDVARARLTGPICSSHLPSWLPSWLRDGISRPVPTAASGEDRLPADCAEALRVRVSPHSWALSLSFIQLFLWLLIAASLPTLVRRP